LGILPSSGLNANSGDGDLAGGRKRSADEAEPSKSASSDEEQLKENDKHAKTNDN
jgi:hypothetical protein